MKTTVFSIVLLIAALLSMESCMEGGNSGNMTLNTNACIAVYPDGQADTILMVANWHITDFGCHCSVAGDEDVIYQRNEVRVDIYRGRIQVEDSDCKVIFCVLDRYIGRDGTNISNYIY